MIKNLKNIKAIILDLDDTLYDCSGTIVDRGRRQVAKTIAKLINCTEEEAYLLQSEIEEKYGTRINIYEKIVALYNLPNRYTQELLEEFIHVDIADITLFPDVINTLTQLKAQGYKLILVTSGEIQIQREKIDILSLNTYFDDIFIADRNYNRAKKDCFYDIIQQYNLKPEEIVCVGDKIDDELCAAKFFGMLTIMFEHGRHYKAYLKEREKHIKPDYCIRHIKDLLESKILKLPFSYLKPFRHLKQPYQ
ncbi:MAG: HAD family hydrolase [Candidatus Jettenia sp.]|nr:MAG: HAD family hydrolase [Candidatus Jettenia sp.]